MKELRFFLRLFAAERRWMIAGAVLMLTTLVASIALLSISGWFITAAALAGIAALPLNFFTPGASIRLFAILRTLSRYAERLVTHNATFRLLSRLRVWFFERAIPLAPARLGGYRSGDLLNRVTADIDALDNLYIRVLAPTVVALILGVLLLAAASLVAPVIAFAVLILLVLAGVGVPCLPGVSARTRPRDGRHLVRPAYPGRRWHPGAGGAEGLSGRSPPHGGACRRYRPPA